MIRYDEFINLMKKANFTQLDIQNSLYDIWKTYPNIYVKWKVSNEYEHKGIVYINYGLDHESIQAHTIEKLHDNLSALGIHVCLEPEEPGKSSLAETLEEIVRDAPVEHKISAFNETLVTNLTGELRLLRKSMGLRRKDVAKFHPSLTKEKIKEIDKWDREELPSLHLLQAYANALGASVSMIVLRPDKVYDATPASYTSLSKQGSLNIKKAEEEAKEIANRVEKELKPTQSNNVQRYLDSYNEKLEKGIMNKSGFNIKHPFDNSDNYNNQ